MSVLFIDYITNKSTHFHFNHPVFKKGCVTLPAICNVPYTKLNFTCSSHKIKRKNTTAVKSCFILEKRDLKNAQKFYLQMSDYCQHLLGSFISPHLIQDATRILQYMPLASLHLSPSFSLLACTHFVQKFSVLLLLLKFLRLIMIHRRVPTELSLIHI